VELYYQPHKSRIREAEFVQHLQKHLPIERIEIAYFPLPQDLVERTLSIRLIEQSAKASALSAKRKADLLAVLVNLPDQVRVAISMKRMTCDVVVVHEGQPFFFEFHEEQHRNLTVSRSKYVFSVSGEKIAVPRFVQRFLRDVWRGQYLCPFTVVWSDWFAVNKSSYVPSLVEGYAEYALPDKFLIHSVMKSA